MGSEIPKGWKRVTVGKCLSAIKGGGTPKRSESSYWDGGIPWASVKDMTAGGRDGTLEYISPIGLETSSSRVVPAGTVVIATRMAVGCAKRFNCDVAINQDLKALFSKAELLDQYLFHWLIWNRWQLEAMATGSTVKGIRVNTINSFPLNLPPLPEQKKIAAILASVDEAIEATEAVIEQTRRVKKGLLQELLTRGIGHSEFKKTPIGEIPVGWEVRPLCEIADLVTGKTPRTSIAEYWNGNIPFITPGDLKDGHESVLHIERSITRAGAEKARVCPAGTVLVTCIGATVGKSALLTSEAAFNQQINGVICDDSMVPRFVYYAIGLQRQALRSRAGRQAVPIVNKTQFGELLIPVPPRSEQERIVELTEQMGSHVDAATKEVEQLKILKKGLLQDLLTGKVRVNVDEAADEVREAAEALAE